MGKKDWRWTTHILVFVLGFFTGRYSKHDTRSLLYSSSDHTQIPSCHHSDIRSQVNSGDENEVFAQSLSLLVSVRDQAMREIEDCSGDRVITSASSPIPSYVSEEVYAMVADLTSRDVSRVLRGKVRESGVSHSTELQTISALETLLNRWIEESRPETYTRTLSFMIDALRRV